jgi:hypothetical protein
VNSFVAFLAIPFFTFGTGFATSTPSVRAIAVDVVSKFVIAAVIGAWWVFARGRRNAAV